MTIELTVLRLLKYRDRCERLHKAVPRHILDPKTQAILDDFVVYFKEFPDASKVRHDEFFTWFRAFRHPKLTDEQAAVYDKMLQQVQIDVSSEVESGLMERLVAADTAYQVAALLQRWNDGDEVPLYSELVHLVERYEQQTERKVRLPWVQDRIEDLLLAEENDTGLHWRLDALNTAMRPLRGGDFVVVAGRPDKGKTSFLTDQLTFMARQVHDMYNGQRSIVWLNNEGPGRRIKQRCYQSALNLTVPDLVEVHKMRATDQRYRHLLDQQYAETAGSLDIIKVMDIHDMWSHEVEEILRNVPAGLVVWDMIDNVKFGGGTTNGGERTDQLLEAMYQWVRILSVKYDIPMIATSQISAEGDGLPYPTLPMLKDSRTGKQGAAEAIITLGASNDPILASSRFIGCTKNKLARAGAAKDPRVEVFFDGDRGRYVMPGA
jgi:replicative DNA helicase